MTTIKIPKKTLIFGFFFLKKEGNRQNGVESYIMTYLMEKGGGINGSNRRETTPC